MGLGARVMVGVRVGASGGVRARARARARVSSGVRVSVGARGQGLGLDMRAGFPVHGTSHAVSGSEPKTSKLFSSASLPSIPRVPG